MFSRIPAILLAGALAALSILPAAGQEAQPADKPDVRIAATISTKPLLTALVRIMKQQKGLRVAVSIDLTSAEALDALAGGQADIALLTRPVTVHDRALYPDVDLAVVPIGMETVALGISNDLWDAGLHAITKEQMRDIYERKITNWKDAGGPDEKITLFSFTQGSGVWEIFAEWLYGDNRKAPIPKVETVANSQDARDDLEFTPGSIALLAASYVDDARCHALGITVAGRPALPTPDQVSAKRYPIVRPMIAVSVGRPTLDIRTVIEFLTGQAGQTLLKSTGALGVEAVPKPTPEL